MINKDEKWDLIIKTQNKLFSFNFPELWKYRDLLFLMVKRDFVSFYKQTILGPIWFFIQPIFTTITYNFIFGKLAGINTDGIPAPLFYLVGIIFWSYFSESLTKTSTVFRDNSGIFGKVYFPRLIMPLSIVVSSLVKFSIQLFLLFIMLIYYKSVGANSCPTIYILLFPLILILMACQALGLGMIISSMTNKYRDLSFLVVFGIQLLMYSTPIIYPLSSVPIKYQWLISLNPMTNIIEIARYAFLGSGTFTWYSIFYSIVISIIILFSGIVIFNKVEKNFIDTV